MLKKARLYRILDKRIHIRFLDKRTIVINVSDLRRDKAMVLTNALTTKLRQMVADEAAKEGRRLKRMYSGIIANSRRKLNEQTAELKALLDEHLSGPLYAESSNTDHVRLTNLVHRIANTNDRLLSTTEYFEVLKALTQKDGLPRIKMIRKAVQDIKTSPVRIAITRILSACFFVVFLFISFLMIRHEYIEEIMVVLTRVPVDNNTTLLNIHPEWSGPEDEHLQVPPETPRTTSRS